MNWKVSMEPRELLLKFRKSGEYVVTMPSGNKDMINSCKIRSRRGVMISGGACRNFFICDDSRRGPGV